MADRFIHAVTTDAATALRSKSGKLEVGAPADIITVTLPAAGEVHSLSLHAILHTSKAENIYIGGEKII